MFLLLSGGNEVRLFVAAAVLLGLALWWRTTVGRTRAIRRSAAAVDLSWYPESVTFEATGLRVRTPKCSETFHPYTTVQTVVTDRPRVYVMVSPRAVIVPIHDDTALDAFVAELRSRTESVPQLS
ncbi:MAG: hypothetical protein FWD11_07040 [Micrococcales bacterium]|nr:hypothetical protein [Micrococcales bacterium]